MTRRRKMLVAKSSLTLLMIQGCEELLRRNWGAFCDCDPLDPVHLDRDRFIEQMEAAGLVTFRVATRKDVDEDPFAVERGIEVGRGLWKLTPAGRDAISGKVGESRRG